MAGTASAFAASLRSEAPRTPVRAKRPFTPILTRKPSLMRTTTSLRTTSQMTSPLPVSLQSTSSRKPGCHETIQVAVRVRSFLPREEGCDLAVRMKEKTTQLCAPNGDKRLFSFDHCFWSHDALDPECPYVDQEGVFQTIGVQLVDNALRGFNSTLFAYGQTGSGKTYSMYGDGSGSEETEGLIPRVCKELFRRIEAAKAEGQCVTYKVQASMMEVYLENIYDLLNCKERLAIRGSLETGFYVPGLRKYDIKEHTSMEMLLQYGQAQRVTASTELNDCSSRAHCLFEIYVKQITTQQTITSKISLVDLAGSERVKDSRVEGVNLTQSCYINKSLLNLGNCMEAIAESVKNPHRQIPFRDSTLTKLLKESLGGNARTILLVTISPALGDSPQTLAALRFADRAKQIKTHAVMNSDALQEAKQCSRLIQEQYEARIQLLQEEMKLEMRQAEIQERELELEREAIRLTEEKGLLNSERENTNQITAVRRRELEQQERLLEQQYAAVCEAQTEMMRHREELDAQVAVILQEQNEQKQKRQEEEEEHMLLLERVKNLEEECDAQQQTMQNNESAWQQEQTRLENDIQLLQQQLTAKEAEWQQKFSASEAFYLEEIAHTRVNCDLKHARMQQEFEVLLESARTKIAGLEDDLAQCRQQLTEARHQRDLLESEMHQQSEELVRQLEEVEAKHRRSLDVHLRDHADMVAAHRKELDAIQKAETARQQALVQQQEEQLADLTETYMRQLEDLKRSHAALVQSLNEEHMEKLNLVEEANKKENEALQSTHEQQLHQLLFNFNAQLVKVREEHATEMQQLQDEHSAQIEQLQDDLALHEVEFRTREAQIKDCLEQQSNAECAKLQTQYDLEVEKLQQQVEVHLTTIQRLKDSHAKELQSWEEEVAELHAELLEMKEEHEQKLVDLHAELELRNSMAITKIKEAHDQEIAALEEELDELSTTHQREIEKLKHQEHIEHEVELTNVRDSHKKEMEMLRKEMQRHLDELSAAHAAEKNELLKGHKLQAEQMMQEAEEQLAACMRNRSQKHSEALAELQELLDTQMHAAIVKHTQEVQQLRAETSRKENEWTQRTSQLEQRHQDELARRGEDHMLRQQQWEQEKSALLQRIALLEGTVTENKVELCDKEDQLQKLSELFMKCSSVLSHSSGKTKTAMMCTPNETPVKSFARSPSLSPGYSLSKPSICLSDISNLSGSYSSNNKENDTPEVTCPMLHL